MAYKRHGLSLWGFPTVFLTKNLVYSEPAADFQRLCPEVSSLYAVIFVNMFRLRSSTVLTESNVAGPKYIKPL
jgi:hypothetical protein